MADRPGSFYVESLGCAKNQVDAEVMVASLEKDGWQRSLSSDAAEVIIINTCSFIAPAREESVNTFMEFRRAYPGKRIIIAGCFSERYGSDLEDMLPEADGIFGNADPSRIAEFAATVGTPELPRVFIPSVGPEKRIERDPVFSFRGSAYVKIAEGCDNRCSYCAIPLIRGPLRSRSIHSVVTEVRDLLEKGVFEINLIAQDLGSFGLDRDGEEFLPLIEALCSLPGEFWLRMLYIHPDRFPMGLLDICERDPRLLPYFDLPFQHSSAKVLRKMGRKGSGAQYLDLIHSIRERLPHACIRSTFLVGHPGEGAAEFKELLSFQGAAQLDWAGFFTYSPEEGTASNSMRNKIGDFAAARVARRRKSTLENRQIQLSELRLDRHVGSEIDILIEEPIKGEALFIGRSYFTAPEVDGAVVVHADSASEGDIVRCSIVGRNGIDMEAIPHGAS